MLMLTCCCTLQQAPSSFLLHFRERGGGTADGSGATTSVLGFSRSLCSTSTSSSALGMTKFGSLNLLSAYLMCRKCVCTLHTHPSSFFFAPVFKNKAHELIHAQHRSSTAASLNTTQRQHNERYNLFFAGASNETLASLDGQCTRRTRKLMGSFWDARRPPHP